MNYSEVKTILGGATPGSKLKFTFRPGESSQGVIDEPMNYALQQLMFMGEVSEMLVMTDAQLISLSAVTGSGRWEDESRTFTVEVAPSFDGRKFAHEFCDQIENLQVINQEEAVSS